MLLLALALGMGCSWCVGFLEDRLIVNLGYSIQNIVGTALIASSCEETCKLMIVAFLLVAFRGHFNDPMDGAIYGAFAGLGLALEEALYYINLSEPSLQSAGEQSVRLVLHLQWGAVGGFGLGLIILNRRKWPIALAAGYLISLLLHFLWDVISGLQHQQMAWHLQYWGVGVLLATITIFGTVVACSHSWSRQMFDSSSDKRLWSWPLSSLFKLRR